jgi:hypothetical protein
MFGVNSADVQGLLEHGLSKLRSNFESSGYALNGWNFGASNPGNSSPRRDTPAPPVLAAIEAPVRRAAIETNTQSLATRAASNPVSAVDLFV